MRIAKLALLPLLLAPVLFAAGCSETSTTSPTAPDGTPLVFAGTVTHRGTSAHDLALANDSLLSITLVEVKVLLWDVTRAPLSSLVLGLGLGQRDEQGKCALSSNVLINKDQLRIYRLSKDAYCITIFDAGAFPEDAVLSYRLQVEITS